MNRRLGIVAMAGVLTLSMLDSKAESLPAEPSGGFQVRYAANLTVGDAYINFTNDGASSTSPGTATGGFQNGNLCVNVYAYSPDEQLVSCCSCVVTPNGLATMSVVNDLASNTLTPIRPSAIVVKLLGSAGSDQGVCNAATVTRTGVNPVAPGLLAWGTTLHAPPTGSSEFMTAETAFLRARLSDAELSRMTQLCGFIQANGSGYGICKSCRFGGLGAASK